MANGTVQGTKELVRRALEKTNAHGLARLVHEQRIYVRALWLLAWLICCCAFLRQFAGFVDRLLAEDVATNFKSNAAVFEYPDLYFCFDSPMSGSRHLALNESSARVINSTFGAARKAMASLCEELDSKECDFMHENELPVMSVNSLPYRFLVDHLGHTMQQSVLNASIVRASGIIYQYQKLRLTEFHHASSLRCFKVALNSTEKRELTLTGPNKSLYFQLMLDAPSSRMGTAPLPALETPVGNVTAPYWALEKQTLYWPDRWSAATLFITEPGHYPSNFGTSVSLESGRSYNIQLEMSEQVHKEDPSKCIEQHPDVQLVNPYDHSAYTFHYDYAFCYNSAVQAQFKREFNATCAFLPHPWPPADRSLYNLSSGWGSLQDVRNFLEGKERLTFDEPQRRCEKARTCRERSYTASVSSVQWPSADSLWTFLRDLDFPKDKDLAQSPALSYLKSLLVNGTNSTAMAAEFVRINFLQLQVTVRSNTGDLTIFNQAYKLESFVADVGGLLGVYLGMSLLTACEMVQFVHDLILLLCQQCRRRNADLTIEGNGKSDDANIEDKELRM